MARSEKNTPLELLRAAERLFATRGIDAVSMRDVSAAAGQANHSASLYHFKDKHNLINSILERHSDPIQRSWIPTLDLLRAHRQDTLEAVIEVMVRSLVSKLDDPDGGTEYLLIVAQLVNSVTFPILDMPATTAPGILALTERLVGNLEPMSIQMFPLRMMGVTALLYSSIAAYHRFVSVGMEMPREAFIQDLIASMAGLLRGAANAEA